LLSVMEYAVALGVGCASAREYMLWVATTPATTRPTDAIAVEMRIHCRLLNERSVGALCLLWCAILLLKSADNADAKTPTSLTSVFCVRLPNRASQTHAGQKYTRTVAVFPRRGQYVTQFSHSADRETQYFCEIAAMRWHAD